MTNSIHALKNDTFARKVDTYSIREHLAERRGEHLDYAIGSKKLDLAIDFIIPKGLPKIGQKPVLGIMMDLHDPYYLFAKEGIIEEGYGKGTWERIKFGKAKLKRKMQKFSWLLYLENQIYNIWIPPIFIKDEGKFLIKRIK